MSNNISFFGNLGQDSELKTVGSSQVLEFSVGNSVGFGDKKNTNWFRCAMWGKRGEKLLDHCKKGTKVFISGEFCARKYTTNDGVEKMSLDVNVNSLAFTGGGASSGGEGGGSNQQSTPTPETDEDLPF